MVTIDPYEMLRMNEQPPDPLVHVVVIEYRVKSGCSAQRTVLTWDCCNATIDTAKGVTREENRRMWNGLLVPANRCSQLRALVYGWTAAFSTVILTGTEACVCHAILFLQGV